MKNLEIEYKDLLNKDIPDLWDRIEAGIEDKNVEVTFDNGLKDNVTENVNDEYQSGNVFDFNGLANVNQTKQKDKFNWKRVIRNCGYIAACLVLFVGGTLIFNIFISSKNMSFAPTADRYITANNAIDAACEEAYEEPQMNEACEDESVKNDFSGIKGIDSQGNEVDSDNDNFNVDHAVDEYVVVVEFVDIDTDIKAKVLDVTADDDLIRIDDVITLVGVEQIVDPIIVGDKLEFVVKPIWNSDNELEFEVVSK